LYQKQKSEFDHLVIWTLVSKKTNTRVRGLVLRPGLIRPSADKLAILVPMLATRRWDQVDLLAMYQTPSLDHWFGTDALGRDIWLSIWFGARVSLSVGLTAALARNRDIPRRKYSRHGSCLCPKLRCKPDGKCPSGDFGSRVNRLAGIAVEGGNLL
jgi:hypothetical protein